MLPSMFTQSVPFGVVLRNWQFSGGFVSNRVAPNTLAAFLWLSSRFTGNAPQKFRPKVNRFSPGFPFNQPEKDRTLPKRRAWLDSAGRQGIAAIPGGCPDPEAGECQPLETAMTPRLQGREGTKVQKTVWMHLC